MVGRCGLADNGIQRDTYIITATAGQFVMTLHVDGCATPGLANMKHQPPTAAYVHVPFCSHRCGYCSFTVVADRLDLAAAYLRAIEIELSQLETPHSVDTLFIGGGTPTELEPLELKQLLALLDDWLPRSPGYEFTIEANPETLDCERVDILLAAGVNRISLGVQSFDDDKLVSLDRTHDASHSLAAIALATKAFDNVSLDLIFAAPGETLVRWQQDIRTALAQGVPHVSTYGLTLEKGTSFWSRWNRRELAEVPEELQRTMFEWSVDELTANGFEHYEVSNFARPRHRCRHNEKYWLGQSYFAFGPGASRYVAGRRETNHRSTSTYLKRMINGDSPVSESEPISALDRAKERLVFGFRRLEGIRETEFNAEFGLSPIDVAGGAIDRFQSLGLLERVDGCLRLTRAGLLVSDSMWREFM